MTPPANVRSIVTLIVVALLLAACGGSSGDSEADASTTSTSQESSDTTAFDAAAGELFISDEGAGCGLYISVDSATGQSVDPLSAIWSVLGAQDFEACPFSEPVELGLITVSDLDEYDQPDWSTVEDHAYFAVSDWPLVQGCVADAASADCGTDSAALAAS